MSEQELISLFLNECFLSSESIRLLTQRHTSLESLLTLSTVQLDELKVSKVSQSKWFAQREIILSKGIEACFAKQIAWLEMPQHYLLSVNNLIIHNCCKRPMFVHPCYMWPVMSVC